MDIKIKTSDVPNIDVLLGEKNNIILRCLECQTFLVPEMVHLLKKRVKDVNGNWTWAVLELCPVCHPNFSQYRKDKYPPSNDFIYLTREEYETTKKYEKAGLIAPVKNESLLIVN